LVEKKTVIKEGELRQLIQMNSPFAGSEVAGSIQWRHLACLALARSSDKNPGRHLHLQGQGTSVESGAGRVFVCVSVFVWFCHAGCGLGSEYLLLFPITVSLYLHCWICGETLSY
jgi:hypothetical protein